MTHLINLLPLSNLHLPHFPRRPRFSWVPSSKRTHPKRKPAPFLERTVLPGVLDISKEIADALAAQESANPCAVEPEWLSFEVAFPPSSPGVTTAVSSRRHTASSQRPRSLSPTRTPASVRSASSRRLPVPLPVPPMPTTPSPRPPSQTFDFQREVDVVNAERRAVIRRCRTYPLSRRRRSHSPLPTMLDEDIPERLAQAETLNGRTARTDSSDDLPATPLVNAFPVPPRSTFTKRLSPQALLRRSVAGSSGSDDTGPLVIVKRTSGPTASVRVSVDRPDGQTIHSPVSDVTMDELLETLDDVYEEFRGTSSGSDVDSWVSIPLSSPPRQAFSLSPPLEQDEEAGDDDEQQRDTIATRARLSSLEIVLAILPRLGDAELGALAWVLPRRHGQTRSGPYSFLVERVDRIRSFGVCAPASRSMPDLSFVGVDEDA
ncbi:hypothetical protein MKEN_00310200 [Mycena kentingensis (nom. inval.)]|nr:hypothetical protein MKEN_00310200 [Mycena kentingensis (nom. inval.)]